MNGHWATRIRAGGRRLAHGSLLAALAGMTMLSTGCLEDPDCGICDPNNLVLESINAFNYAGDRIHLVDPECEGPACPERFDSSTWFVTDVGRCRDSEAAKESPRGPEEYCKVSPLLTGSGLEMVFNNLLDASSVELVRRRPDNPQLHQVYDWKSQVAHLEGPSTRYNGDFRSGSSGDPDQVSRLVNLSCIDNLADRGIAFSHVDMADPATNPCNAMDPSTGLPMKLRAETRLESYRGKWTLGGNDCTTPQDGPDTCCSECDFLLSTKVAKYGLDPAGTVRSPHEGSALQCDPTADRYRQCRDFVTSVDRTLQEDRYDYAWSCDPAEQGCARETDQAVPQYDRLRETHPDDRPAWLERNPPACVTNTDCTSADGHDLPGTECTGVDDDGNACAMGVTEDCREGRCRAEWFVGCVANDDLLEGQGHCVDNRFSDDAAGACLLSDHPFEFACDDGGCIQAPAGAQLAHCDADTDGILSADECCLPELSDEGGVCDPVMQQLHPIGRWHRQDTLPDQTKECVCVDDPSEDCAEVVRRACFDEDGKLKPERAGQFAVKFVGRPGGIIYDPAMKGIAWRVADIGDVPRAKIESCAAGQGRIGRRNRKDGWLAHDGRFVETDENFDRGLCSDSQYTLVFSTPDAGEHIRDKAGNTLAGKTRYTFETPQFHVRPGSGQPVDNIRINGCQEYSIAFSNKYDLSPENLDKLELWNITDRGDWVERVAGGPGCVERRADLVGGAVPCLVFNVQDHAAGRVAVAVDTVEFITPLREGSRYRLFVPGLDSAAEAADPEKYAAAFWDVCGQPLVLGGADDWKYDFTIDPASCREDPDGDGWPLGCDNAEDVFNKQQGDMDRDGVGDTIDLCPTVPTASSNGADSDNDGVGNECDVCRRAAKQYNKVLDQAPQRMAVRGNPVQLDSDGDGIGDACDNCVHVPNCGNYGPSQRWRPGDPIDDEIEALCQSDEDENGVGDACEGDISDIAAGPVGMDPEDDFDQDGVANVRDACPRIPLSDWISCEGPEDCPEGRKCARPDLDTPGVCNHDDLDGDDVGDVCDTCAHVPNPEQFDAEKDDPDRDFVGRVCEPGSGCEVPDNPRRFGFHEVSVQGACCTVQLELLPDGGLLDLRTELPLMDPDLVPVRLECSTAEQDARTCRKLPPEVAELPGVLKPPAGCEEALGGMLPRENVALTIEDFAGDTDALWDRQCVLPFLDQDFDAVGDRCDLCPFAYDPTNRPYTDAFGKQWPGEGHFCQGPYLHKACMDEEEDPGTGGSDESGGDESGTGDTGAP
ncbi:MAG: thrombospondin type 3 repeat-containing protein [Myxococcota bacterium]